MKKIGLFLSLMVISLSIISCTSNTDSNQKVKKDESLSTSTEKEKKEDNNFSTYEGEVVSISENDNTYSFKLSDLSLSAGDNEAEKLITSNDIIILNISKERVGMDKLVESISENEKIAFEIDSMPAITYSIPPQILDSSIHNIKKVE